MGMKKCNHCDNTDETNTVTTYVNLRNRQQDDICSECFEAGVEMNAGDGLYKPLKGEDNGRAEGA